MTPPILEIPELTRPPSRLDRLSGLRSWLVVTVPPIYQFKTR